MVRTSRSRSVLQAIYGHTHGLIRPRRRPVCPAEEHLTVQRTFQAVDSVSCEVSLPRWERRSRLGSRATWGGVAGPSSGDAGKIPCQQSVQCRPVCEASSSYISRTDANCCCNRPSAAPPAHLVTAQRSLLIRYLSNEISIISFAHSRRAMV